MSQAAWRDVERHREESGGENEGMLKTLVDARELVQRAIRAALLREGNPDERARVMADAIDKVRDAVDGGSDEY